MIRTGGVVVAGWLSTLASVATTTGCGRLGFAYNPAESIDAAPAPCTGHDEDSDLIQPFQTSTSSTSQKWLTAQPPTA
ncbi:MAG TPA: hypothetical protein PLF40_22550 [Kofleriaceae bacterium]|nr:hypothetical protein [Kofleriaceae bacterium]